MNFDIAMKLSSVEETSNSGEPLYLPEGCDPDTDVMYTTEPMPFIQSVANGKLVVNPRARDMLSRIEKPLVVISIAGLYRTGNNSTTPFEHLSNICRRNFCRNVANIFVNPVKQLDISLIR